MKNCIVYASTHHGNTKKVVDAIADETGVEAIDATQVHEKNLSEYDLIGFASGIFFTKFSEQVLDFARVNLVKDKKVFFIATAGNPLDINFRAIEEIAEEKNCQVVGRYQCKGFDTFGPFKIVGGIQKGHPDESELAEAVEFYKGLVDATEEKEQ